MIFFRSEKHQPKALGYKTPSENKRPTDLNGHLSIRDSTH